MEEKPAAPANNGAFQKVSFLIYLLVVSVAFVYMLRMFLMPIFMASVFTGLTYPIYFWLLMKTNNKIISALITLLGLMLILVLPLIAVGFVAFGEANHFITTFDLDSWRGRLESVVTWARDHFPAVLGRVSPRDLSNMASGGVQNALQFILKNSANISISVADNLLSFFLMLFMMFYFYVDGHRILQKLIKWSPLKDEYERILIDKFVSVSKGTLKGILLIGVIQGIIGAILFWAVGLRSPIFLGVLMVFASIVPAVGTSMIWGPVAVMFMFEGDWVRAISVMVVGAAVIGSVDNLVRPILVGKDIKMHDLLVLLSTLGGLGLFGLAGFIIGPVIASLFLAIWNIFEEIFADELAENRITGFRTEKISQLMKSPPPGTEPAAPKK